MLGQFGEDSKEGSRLVDGEGGRLETRVGGWDSMGLPVILWGTMMEKDRGPPPPTHTHTLRGQHSDVCVVWHICESFHICLVYIHVYCFTPNLRWFMKIYIQTEEKTPFWDIPQKNRFNGNRWHNCHLKPGFSCPPWCKAINDIIIWNLPSDWYRWWADQKGVPVTRLTSGGIWWASAVVVPSVSVLLKVPCVSSRLLSPFGTFWILIFLFCISIWTLLFRCTLFSCFICFVLAPWTPFRVCTQLLYSSALL